MKHPIRTRLAQVLAGAAMLALAACGGQEAASDGSAGADAGGQGSEAVVLVAKEFVFEPATLTIPANTDVELAIKNEGVIEHDFTLDDPAVMIHADAGTTASGAVNLPAGAYTFYCSVAGHRESGMEGTLVAE